MGVELHWWLIILTVFSLYSILSSIELALALLRVEPRLAPAASVRRIFTPRWEITNILLVFGCVGFAVLSNDAFTTVVGATWSVLLLGLLALLLRGGLLAYLFAHKSAPGGKLPDYVFAAASFLVPMSLGAAGIYMVTGEPFWLSGVGAGLFVAMMVGLLALSAGFIFYIGGSKAPQGVVVSSRILNTLLAGLLAIVLVGILSGSHLLNLPYAYLAVMAASIALAQSVCMASGKEWRMWWVLVAIALVAPFLIGLANYPYLIFPDVRFDV